MLAAPRGWHNQGSPAKGRHRPSSCPGPQPLGEGLSVHLAPPRPPPDPGLARVGAGPARSPLQALFPLVGAAARARKRAGAEAPRSAGLRRRPLPSARPAQGLAAMHPTPPGPLGDCLRDWEELQQHFQSIQVSANAGARWPRAMSLWMGVKGRAALCQAAGSLGSGEPGVVLEGGETPGPGVWAGLPSASLECPTEAHFARAAAATPVAVHCARQT